MYRCLRGFPVCTASSECHLLLKFSVMQRLQDLIQETAMLWQFYLIVPAAKGPQLTNCWSKLWGVLLASHRCHIIVTRALAYSRESTGCEDEMSKIIISQEAWQCLQGRLHMRVCYVSGCLQWAPTGSAASQHPQDTAGPWFLAVQF